MTGPRPPHRSSRLSRRISTQNFNIESGYSILSRSVSPWYAGLAACFALVLCAAFGITASLIAGGVSPTMGVTATARDDSRVQGRAKARMRLVTPATPIIRPPTSNEPFSLETMPVVSGGLLSTWRGVQDDIRAEGLVLARCLMECRALFAGREALSVNHRGGPRAHWARPYRRY